MKNTTDNAKTELSKELKQDNYLQDIDKKTAKTELLILKKKYSDVLEELKTNQSLDDLWTDIHRRSVDVKIEKTSNNPKTESTAILMASDRHIEETIDPETINYLNEYNPKIAKQRAEKFWNN
jgi:phenylalanyl-tRNA synthetase alpha subunit